MTDFKYFPERYYHNRSHVGKAFKIFKDADFDNYPEPFHSLRDFVRSPVQEWHIGNEIPSWLLEKEPKVSQDNGPDSPEFKTWFKWWKEATSHIKKYPRLEDETDITKALIDFEKGGKNIFSYSDFLVELLSNTEVGEVRYEDIKIPFNTIYLSFNPISKIQYPLDSFEKRNQITIEGTEFYLDGAFIRAGAHASFEILLTFIDPKADYKIKRNIATDCRFPVYKFVLDFYRWNSEKETSEVKEGAAFKDSTIVFSDMWDEADEVGQIDYSRMLKAIKEPETCYDAEWEEYVLMNESLKLIVNSLCYINYPDRDLAISSTNEQATPLLKQLDIEKNNRQRNKIFEKLHKLKYSKVHLFGSNLKREDFATSDKEIDPHWRRGHWRNQPYGENLSLKKLIWIKPTIVRKDKGTPEAGHIYEV